MPLPPPLMGKKPPFPPKFFPGSFPPPPPLFPKKTTPPPPPRPTFRKVRRRLSCVESEKSTYIVNYIQVWKMESGLKSRLQHTGTLSDAAWPPRRLSYHPAVFFRPPSPSFALSPTTQKFGASREFRFFICLLFKKKNWTGPKLRRSGVSRFLQTSL